MFWSAVSHCFALIAIFNAVAVDGQSRRTNNLPNSLLIVTDDVVDELKEQGALAKFLIASANYLSFGVLRLTNLTQISREHMVCGHLNEGYQAIVSVAQSNALRADVRRAAQENHIPTVQLDSSAWMLTDRPTATQSLARFQEAKDFVNFIPPSSVMLSGLLEVLKHDEDQNVVVIVETDYYEPQITNKLAAQIQQMPARFMQVPAVQDALAMQAQLRNLTSTNKGKTAIVFLMRVSTAEAYFVQQDKVSTPNDQRWIVVTRDNTHFRCTACNTLRALYLQLRLADSFDSNNFEQFLEYLEDRDVDVPSIQQSSAAVAFSLMTTLANIIQSGRRDAPYLCYSRSALIDSVVRNPLYSRDYSAPDTVFDQMPLIISALKFLTPDERYHKRVANWTAEKGLMFRDESVGELDVDPAIRLYHVAIVVNPPFVERVNMGNNMFSYRGYVIDLLETLKVHVGFEYQLYEVPGKQEGLMNEEGAWSGAIYELLIGNAEIALPVKVDMQRSSYVDFTHPIYADTGFTLLMKSWRRQMVRTNSTTTTSATSSSDGTFYNRWRNSLLNNAYDYLCGMEPGVWICLFFMLLISLGLLFCYDRLNPYRAETLEFTDLSMKAKTSNMLRALMLTDTQLPETWAARLVIAAWWFLMFCTVVAYAASLSVTLWSVYAMQLPMTSNSMNERSEMRSVNHVRSLEDLSLRYKWTKGSGISFSTTNGSAADLYFRRRAMVEERLNAVFNAMKYNESMTPQERAQMFPFSSPFEETYTTMWHQMQDSGFPGSDIHAINRVLESKSPHQGYAWIGDATTVRFAELTDCNVQQVGPEFGRQPLAIAVQQGSPLRDMLNASILRLIDRRQLEHFKAKWWNQHPDKMECEYVDELKGNATSYSSQEGPPSSAVRQVKIENIGVAVAITFVAFVVSILILSLEWCCSKRQGQEARTKLKHEPYMTTVQSATNTDYANGVL